MGRGSSSARIVLVGEAPGTEEDKAGRPFVGAAGRILSDLLVRAELVEDDLWITNAVACWPPPPPGGASRNGKPPVPCLEACRDLHLVRQLEAVRPRVVVALGAYAAGSLLHVSPHKVRMVDTISVPLDGNPWTTEAVPAVMLSEIYDSRQFGGTVPLLVAYHPAFLDRLGYWQDKDGAAAQATVATLIAARRLAT